MARRTTAKRSPPAFQFYAGDWLSSTLGMAAELKGIYVDLLCWSWENGPLPDDPAWRQRVIGGSAETAARRWAAIRKRWKKTARGWVNLRLERQRKVQQILRARAQAAAARRWDLPLFQRDRADRKVESRRIRPHVSSIEHALRKQLLDRSPSPSPSPSPSEDRREPAPPVYRPPFKVYAAIAGCAVDQTPSGDLGEITEAFKGICVRQQIPYDGEIARKAIDAVLVSRLNVSRRKRRA